MTFVQIGEFDWLLGRQKRVDFRKNETIHVYGMKLKLGIHAKDISLYISCVFYSGRKRTLVAMATYISHRLIMGKVEIDNFCLRERTGLVVRALDSGSGDPGSILGRVGVLFP